MRLFQTCRDPNLARAPCLGEETGDKCCQQHRLLRGWMEKGVSAVGAVPEPPAVAGVPRAGGSEGHRPQGPSWGTAGGRLPAAGTGLRVTPSSPL